MTPSSTISCFVHGRYELRAEAMAPDAIASTVAQRLEELRALDELARYLKRK